MWGKSRNIATNSGTHPHRCPSCVEAILWGEDKQTQFGWKLLFKTNVAECDCKCDATECNDCFPVLSKYKQQKSAWRCRVCNLHASCCKCVREKCLLDNCNNDCFRNKFDGDDDSEMIALETYCDKHVGRCKRHRVYFSPFDEIGCDSCYCRSLLS